MELFIWITIATAIAVFALIWRGFATGDPVNKPSERTANNQQTNGMARPALDASGDFSVGKFHFSKRLLIFVTAVAVLMFLVPPMNTRHIVPVFDGWHPISLLGSDPTTMVVREIAIPILLMEWDLLCLISFVANAVIRRD